jgi:DinB superfamily
MVLARNDLGGVMKDSFDLPAFALQVESLVNTGILADFVETLGPVSMKNISDLKRRYASLIIHLDRLRPALASSDVFARSTKETWSIKEVLGHLIDTDHDIWWPRIEVLLREDHPHFADIDHRGLVTQHNWQSQPLDDILAKLMRARWDYAMKLNAISPIEFERCGEHAVLGEICILRIVQLLVAHDEHYLAMIRRRIEEFPGIASPGVPFL